jgi:hypothetical protein
MPSNHLNIEWKQENGLYKCPYCEKEYTKNGICTHIWKQHTEEGKLHNPNKGYHTGRIAWNKGLTEKNDERVKKGSNTLRNNYKEGIIFPSFKNKHHTNKSIEKISKSLKKHCENIDNRKRLRDIGRKGGYGTKGYTERGTYYQSNFEKQCFEWLEKNKINFEAHKEIPNSSKISDIYLPHKDLWIELDGINREQKKKYIGKSYDYWLQKLQIYEEQKLNYKICYSFNEFALIV